MTVVPSHALGTARMADGTTLRTLHWEPASEPWAVAELVHGLGEHGGRYETVAKALTDAGIDTWAYDHRGNGGSGGRRGHVDRWTLLHDDLEARLVAVRQTRPGLPLVLYGHSLGGLVACGYVLSGHDRPLPDVLVLSAPALDDNVGGAKHWLVPKAARILPSMATPHDLPKGGLSRDPEVEARAAADPLCGKKSTLRFVAEAFGEQDRLRGVLAGLGAMPVPTYVFHGSADPIVPGRRVGRVRGDVERDPRRPRRAAPRVPPRAGARGRAGRAWSIGSGRRCRGRRRSRRPRPRCRLAVDNCIPPPGSAYALRVWRQPQTRGT